MIKFLASLLALLNKLFDAQRERRLEEQGRQKAKAELDANVEKAQSTLASPDPVRTERLRSKYDRSRNSDQ